MIEVGDIWWCKIGKARPLVDAPDFAMREAVATAYRAITGEHPDFIFSGWGGKLTEAEQRVVDHENNP